MSTPQTDFDAPKSKVMNGLIIIVDHHFVFGLLSMALAGRKVGWSPLEVTELTGRVLLHVDVDSNPNLGISAFGILPAMLGEALIVYAKV